MTLNWRALELGPETKQGQINSEDNPSYRGLDGSYDRHGLSSQGELPEGGGPYPEPPRLGRMAVIMYVAYFFSLRSIKAS